MLLWIIFAGLMLFPLPAQTDDLPQPPQVAELGRGTVAALDWHPDGAVLAVDGARGLWFYDETLADLAHFDEPGSLFHVTWSPDGDQLVTVDADYTLTLWDVTLNPYTLTSNRVWTYDLDHIDRHALDIAWAPTADRLAVRVRDAGTHILDVNTGERIVELPDLTFSMAWHPDGTMIAGSVDLGEEIGLHIRVWDASTGEEIRTFLGVDPGLFWGDLAWNDDGTILVGGTSVPSALHVWDTSTGNLLNDPDPMLGEFGATFGIWWSDDGETLFTAEAYVLGPGSSNRLLTWNTSDWTIPAEYSEIGLNQRANKRPNHTEWTTISPSNLILHWSLEEDNPLYTLLAHTVGPIELIWSPDDRYLAANHGTFPSYAVAWDLEAEAEIIPFSLTDFDSRLNLIELRWYEGKILGFLRNLAITAPGSNITGRVVQWDLATNEGARLVAEFPGDFHPAFRWSNDFERVYYRSYAEAQTRYIIAEHKPTPNDPINIGDEIVRIDVGQHQKSYWSADDTMLALTTGDPGGPATVEIYDASTGDHIIQAFTAEYGSVINVTWQPDSRTVAVAWSEYIPGRAVSFQRLDLVEIDHENATAMPYYHFSTVTDATIIHAWHDDLVALNVNGDVDIYAVDDAVTRIAHIPDTDVRSLAWSNDGTRLAGGHVDGTIRIWDVRGVGR